jgi:hypothetical protein
MKGIRGNFNVFDGKLSPKKLILVSGSTKFDRNIFISIQAVKIKLGDKNP